MMELDTIKLENKEYAIIAEMNINGTNYMHLANVENPSDFCIRKVIMKDGEEIITGLDDRKEFDMAMQAFSKKHCEDLEI